MFRKIILTGVVLTLAASAQAQVSREEGVDTVARAYDGTYDEFAFQGQAGQILFATLDADIYQTEGRGIHDQSLEAAVAAEEGGGCADEAQGGFCLQVLDAAGNVLCWADRPRYPGWQRDPRLACPLPSEGAAMGRYTLRVVYQEGETSCGGEPAAGPDLGTNSGLFYLLNVSLRNSVPEGNIKIAIGQSGNRM